MNNTVIHCENLSKKYQEGPNQIEVLNNIDFSMQAGERVAIIGPSGSGKSTLLHVLSGLDKPSSGEVYLEGKAWSALSEQAMCELRNRYFGFVYQFHHLLPEFTALENVMMPGILGQDSVDSAREKATAVLEAVGLGARLQHRPSQLSGGERQRVAIARALVQNPRCVFADEPTGNLDRATAMAVFDMMLSLNKTYRTALLIVTHDQQLAEKMDKIYLLSDKRLILQ